MKRQINMKAIYLFLFAILLSSNTYSQFSDLQLFFPSTTGVSSLQASDIDGDGDMDALISFNEPPRIVWYKNLGDGSFETQPTQITSEILSPELISPADIDGDGDNDFFVFSSDNNTFSWFENINGDGTQFTPHLISNLDYNIKHLFITDIDNDDDEDILIASDDGNKVVWFSNMDRLGNFTDEIIISNTTLLAQYVHAGDLDGDGDLDILSISRGDNKIAWYENIDGQGNFSTEIIIATNIFSAKSILSADLNNDGHLDVLYTLGSRVAWIANNGDGTFGDQVIVENFITNLKSAKTLDVGSDGDLDIVVESESSLIWLENLDGLGNYGEANNAPGGFFSANSNFISIADVDNNGSADVLVGSTGEAYGLNLSWFSNADNAIDLENPKLIGFQIDSPSVLDAGDIDNDGDQDFLMQSGINISSNAIYWFENNYGQLIPHLIPNKTADEGQYKPYLSDLDGDGDLDYVYNRADRVGWYENTDGNGNFVSKEILEEPGYVLNYSKPGDIDGDGDMDLVAYYYSPHLLGIDDVIGWYENTDGLGSFTFRFIADFIADREDVILKDIDIDGDLDIINVSNVVSYFKNNNGDFSEISTIITGIGIDAHAGILFFDVDEDNDEDLIFIDGTGNTVPDLLMWKENLDGIGTFGDPILIDEIDANSQFSGADLELFKADADSDGDSDILITFKHEATTIGWYENLNGQNTFGDYETISTEAGDYVTHLEAMDFDLDGDTDIISISEDDDKFGWFESFSNNNNLISGTVFWDINENGVFDSSENTINGSKIFIQPNPLVTWPAQNGRFEFATALGDHDISCQPLEGWVLTTDSIVTVMVNNNMPIEQNFGLKPATEFYNSSIDINAAATRCGFTVPFWVNYSNNSNQIVDGTVTLTLDTLVTFIEASPMPSLISGNELTWNVNDLLPTQEERINLFLEMPDASFLGTWTNFNASFILTDHSGTVVQTSTDDYHSQINCAYDPNDKLVEPNFENFDNYTLFGDTLEYTIRFQNTGTDTAFNIQVEDFLDKNLDLNTFEVVATSHEYSVTLNENGKAIFYFRNILLPDWNVNEPNSHGFIKYRIKSKEALSEATLIKNDAGIFFDFNPPIITNETTNVMVSQFPVFSESTAPLCFDSQDGSINISFPTPDFNFNWENGQTGHQLTDLSDDIYPVTITNSNNQIVAVSEFTLEAPEELSLSLSSTPATGSSANGSAMVEVTGGISPYRFTWNTTPPQSTPVINNLISGDYTVTISDNNECEATSTITVDQVVNLENLEEKINFKIQPNPTLNSSFISFDVGSEFFWHLKIFSNQGVLIQDFSSRETTNQNILIEDLPSGVYQVILMTQDQFFIKKLIVFSN